MKNSTTCFITGLLGGVAIGAALGILYAPDKGINTREKFGQRAGEIKDDLYQKIDDLKDYVSDAVGEMKEKMVDVKEKVIDIKEKATKAKEKQAEEA